MKKLKIALIVLCSVVAASLIVLAALTYIPLTRTLEYDMHGYIIQADGQIVEQFPFSITCKDYSFIIDPPGESIEFAGDKLTKIERDAFLIYFNFDSAPFSENFESGHSVGKYEPERSEYVFGSLIFNTPLSTPDKFGATILNLEDGSFCMYAEDLVENCFIVGVSDPDTDPLAVMEYYRRTHHTPKLPSPGEN